MQPRQAPDQSTGGGPSESEESPFGKGIFSLFRCCNSTAASFQRHENSGEQKIGVKMVGCHKTNQVRDFRYYRRAKVASRSQWRRSQEREPFQ